MIIIACEVFRPEMELLAKEMTHPPLLVFLSQRLHDYPEKLRAGVQEEIERVEGEYPEENTIALGYALCGKGLTGVTSRRTALVIPKLHDCIPFLLGHEPNSIEASSREGTTYWMSAGWLDSFLAEFHLSDSRFKKYAEKFGASRAEKMVKAENALLSAYKNACHIRWPEIGDGYVEQAKKVAKAAGLEYSEMEGKSFYLRALMNGGEDRRLFLHLQPGQTIDMNMDGEIIAVSSGNLQ